MLNSNNLLLLERKMIRDGYVIYYMLADNQTECFKEFDDLYKAYNFAKELENFKNCTEMSNGKASYVIDSKKGMFNLLWIKMQLDEQEAFAEANKKVLEVIGQFRAL